MYYTEKWENGLLYYKTTPQGSWKLKTMTLADLYEGVTNKHITLKLALDTAYSLGVGAEKQWNSPLKT